MCVCVCVFSGQCFLSVFVLLQHGFMHALAAETVERGNVSIVEFQHVVVSASLHRV